MSEVLSQQEIDRLLTGISSGEIKEENISEVLEHKEIYEYDFRRPTRVSKDQLKTIRNMHENFSELFGFYLASRLQTMTSIDLLAVDQLRYSEYVLSIANPCVVYIFDIEETEGRAVFELPPNLVFMIVERLLGGIGGKATQPRAITPIEQRLMQPVIREALKKLSDAWKPIQELTFNLYGFESNSDFVQIAPASEIVIVISFEVRVGEDTFLVNLCYPSFALEDVITKLNVQFYPGNLSNRNKRVSYDKLTAHLQKTDMEVKSILGRSQITVQELMKLEVGDVITTNRHVEEEIPIYIQNRLKYFGRPGIVDDKLAIKITNEADNKLSRGEE